MDGRKYVEYVLSCIKAKPLFGTISLDADTYWEQLVWMDRSNYGGVSEFELPRKGGKGPKRRRIAEDSDSEGDDNDDDDGHADEDEDEDEEGDLASQLGTNPNIQIDMHWNIATYLPEPAQVFFERVIGEWLYRDCEAQMRERMSRGGQGLTPMRAAPVKNNPQHNSSTQSDSSQVAARKELFRSTSQNMISLVPKIKSTMPGDSAVLHR